MKAPRFAFSIMSLILLTALVAVSVSRHLEIQKASDEIARLNSEIRDLKLKAGHIDVKDPRKAYVKGMETIDDLTWRFRVYSPPGKHYSLRCSQYWMATGFPPGGGGGEHSGESIITVALRMDKRGRWVYHHTVSSSDGKQQSAHSNTIPSSRADGLIGALSGKTTDRKQRECDPDKSIEILRFRAGAMKGLVVWLEPIPDEVIEEHRKRIESLTGRRVVTPSAPPH